jgi:hypothetical protein
MTYVFVSEVIQTEALPELTDLARQVFLNCKAADRDDLESRAGSLPYERVLPEKPTSTATVFRDAH